MEVMDCQLMRRHYVGECLGLSKQQTLKGKDGLTCEKEIWKEEKYNHVKGKRPAQGAEV